MPFTSTGGWDFYLSKGKKRLGLVLIHEIFGYDAYVETVARDMSSAGFTAAAIDLFHGKKATNLEEGSKLKGAVTKEVLSDGISKGVELIRKETEAEKVGAMGFCMGGGLALQSACDLGLDFCVDFYGSMENVDDASRLRGPVLLILGSEDTRVTPWAFEKFLPAATKYKVRVEAELYPNAKHGFHRPRWEGHNPEAAHDAWEKTVGFLSRLAR